MADRPDSGDEGLRSSFLGPIRAMALVATAASLAAGVALVFVYRPRSWGWLRALHSGGAGIAVISVVVHLVVARAGGVQRSRRTLVGALVALLTLGAAFATGPWMAWSGGERSDRGLWSAATSQVEVNGRTFSRNDLLVTLAVHVALSVCAVAVLIGGYLRAEWRQRRVRHA